MMTYFNVNIDNQFIDNLMQTCRHIDRLYILVILLQMYFLANWDTILALRRAI